MKRGCDCKKGKTDITDFFKTKKPAQSQTVSSDEVWDHPLFKYLTDPGWRQVLEPVFKKYVKDKEILNIASLYEKETIYPPKELIFNAFNVTPFEQVKVVIIGQDPYIKKDQAHGLCFSVNKGIAIPPSLKTIYKELKRTVPEFQIPKHGYLIEWAKQGVLMLNATLTVKEGKSNSHEKMWKNFTDDIINVLCQKKEGLVYLLWGAFAQKKASGVDSTKNCCLKAPHPSPLAKGGFDNCNHFVQCNDYLKQIGKEPINWVLTL
ncbi:uracil-DNA glycosylase, putative [Entamoeba dispar SAW760]|uniref:Uracil-DNA glycosylase n=1 Tax=Entamoeba dispar (strain ATCC PRA-260 / SAW760) TaxID=370354 RepID=B0EEF9_ENTDS|nr:uracil-DNA glycosylase, putative [Entamoeba dispar SAW760]EDR27073.1 uracil-DNA glycosylase, putative [Entamoeba dispar SAW760]|eukprot:EDR27073.1 uracil-DNA glycosylase, putative [Entamoeba dispar SAW760]